MIRRLLAVLLLLAVVGGGAALWISRDWWGRGPAKAPVTVQVEKGGTLASAARALEKAGAIRSTTNFLRFARRFGPDRAIRAGEFEIPAEASGAEILEILQNGKPIQHLVTVPEGMPSILVFDRLNAEKDLTGTIAVPAEGSILPDSYSFERGEPRAAVLARMQAAMREALAEEWKERRPSTVAKSPQQTIILASIVEKETALASERPMVAAVYSNRVRKGMKLQADPTVIYPITKGKPLGRRIRRSELNAVNGYNTYASPGLPIGPIANPGRASIAAVLNPAKSPALYFVASGKGGHVFATTLAEHNANVQKFYALRRAKGEM
ncbi:endolytic transglycosylase MltG [Sphingomonas montanisoli]|uniref:Endolytic murein transglycosylase n=1 Tax=Sphingomonas montanisoli TaxID=2606412 RepID=A0A5D9BZI5_9SPHN|nr:endolytic transglycosylase MltG [Sphingomonas montanisoli]TZG25008.1 endolytic transglycosylase MltG [Sphingomonas montanisoli]